jgi:hypothetical protein
MTDPAACQLLRWESARGELSRFSEGEMGRAKDDWKANTDDIRRRLQAQLAQ